VTMDTKATGRWAANLCARVDVYMVNARFLGCANATGAGVGQLALSVARATLAHSTRAVRCQRTHVLVTQVNRNSTNTTARAHQAFRALARNAHLFAKLAVSTAPVMPLIHARAKRAGGALRVICALSTSSSRPAFSIQNATRVPARATATAATKVMGRPTVHLYATKGAPTARAPPLTRANAQRSRRIIET